MINFVEAMKFGWAENLLIIHKKQKGIQFFFFQIINFMAAMNLTENMLVMSRKEKSHGRQFE